VHADEGDEPGRARDAHPKRVGDPEREGQRHEDQGDDARAPGEVPEGGHDPPDTTPVEPELPDPELVELEDEELVDGVEEGCCNAVVVVVVEELAVLP
jgi:hypothetical protein